MWWTWKLKILIILKFSMRHYSFFLKHLQMYNYSLPWRKLFSTFTFFFQKYIFWQKFKKFVYKNKYSVVFFGNYKFYAFSTKAFFTKSRNKLCWDYINQIIFLEKICIRWASRSSSGSYCSTFMYFKLFIFL